MILVYPPTLLWVGRYNKWNLRKGILIVNQRQWKSKENKVCRLAQQNVPPLPQPNTHACIHACTHMHYWKQPKTTLHFMLTSAIVHQHSKLKQQPAINNNDSKLTYHGCERSWCFCLSKKEDLTLTESFLQNFARPMCCFISSGGFPILFMSDKPGMHPGTMKKGGRRLLPTMWAGVA